MHAFSGSFWVAGLVGRWLILVVWMMNPVGVSYELIFYYNVYVHTHLSILCCTPHFIDDVWSNMTGSPGSDIMVNYANSGVDRQIKGKGMWAQDQDWKTTHRCAKQVNEWLPKEANNSKKGKTEKVNQRTEALVLRYNSKEQR
ncbi:10707_t:CDS:2 [Acaulospora morrowiae]|uniref:10707_t:CDS:1 n=1 Tax=Acaulospora morrowiae TaxID=94023 RepID=A0A9N8VT06_9GLOM|nr:10707_t:CDS:2 [Acaulospora morrowiae]